MSTPPSPAFNALDRLLTGETPTAEFEQWVYGTPELAQEVGPDAYHELLEFDYRQPHAIHALRTVVERIYDTLRPAARLSDRAYRNACGLLTGEVPFIRAVRELAMLYHAGLEWIPTAFVGIESELDGVPLPEQYSLWEPEALQLRLAEVQPWIDAWMGAAVECAEQMLKTHFPAQP